MAGPERKREEVRRGTSTLVVGLRFRPHWALSDSDAKIGGKWEIFTNDFTKEWVESIALASIAITKELIFYNAMANAQCERQKMFPRTEWSVFAVRCNIDINTTNSLHVIVTIGIFSSTKRLK